LAYPFRGAKLPNFFHLYMLKTRSLALPNFAKLPNLEREKEDVCISVL